MRRYETVYIANPNLEDEALKEVVDKFSDLIKKNEGSLVKVDEWGKRKLAYEVKRFDKGYYVLLDFCGLPEMVTELERNLKLDDRVLKYLTVKVDDEVDPAGLIADEVQEVAEGEDQQKATPPEPVDEE